MLRLTQLCTGYDKRQTLYDVSVHVDEGELVGLIGHNGAGKSTLLRAIAGLIQIWSGVAYLNGEPMVFRSPSQARQRGIAYFPQGGRVFPGLTVRENLLLGGAILRESHLISARLAAAYRRFPVLQSKSFLPAAFLSGGEKQMLALETGLMSGPRLLLVDEPSLGLAPSVTREVLQYLRALASEIGAGVIVVEQKVREIVRVSDRFYALRQGRVIYEGVGGELFDEDLLKKVYL